MELVYLSKDEWLEDANKLPTAEKLLEFLENDYLVALLTQAIDYEAVMEHHMKDYCEEMLSHAVFGEIFKFDRTFAAYVVALDKSNPLEPLCTDFTPGLANLPYTDEFDMAPKISRLIIDRK